MGLRHPAVTPIASRSERNARCWATRTAPSDFPSTSPTWVADVFRRRSRRREVALDETVPPAVGGPEEAVLAAEQRAEVAGAFRRLRADQQEVLALRVLGGLSAAQVGEVLGKSEGAVRVAQHRALRSLREAMGVTAG